MDLQSLIWKCRQSENTAASSDTKICCSEVQKKVPKIWRFNKKIKYIYIFLRLQVPKKLKVVLLCDNEETPTGKKIDLWLDQGPISRTIFQSLFKLDEKLFGVTPSYRYKT